MAHTYINAYYDLMKDYKWKGKLAPN
jgi:hypothetical protein